MKTRREEAANYSAIWLSSGKTIRIAIDNTKEIGELEFPEFYDIKLTSHCQGNCPYCYQDSKSTDCHTENVVGKLRALFNSMKKENLPFQIAYGGGEPTSHPNFNEVMKMTKEEFDICPNFTTNGMWVSNNLAWINNHLDVVEKYCGGVAISCHPHLEWHWTEAAWAYTSRKIRLNFHNIISDKESIDRFLEIFNKWRDKVEYFVLLPYGNVGRAEKKEIDWDYFVSKFPEDANGQIAFGANFYPYLQRNELKVKVSLYEPEIMSKYVDLKDNGYLYPSSFSDKVLKKDFLV